jgi:dTDP-L-rhamnose 4-epimerase
MSLYGEGLYRTAGGELRTVQERTLEQLRRGDWEWRDEDGIALQPAPTPEDKAPALASVYALSKFDQERMCLMIGRAYGIPTVALRFFNAYGPRQALSNPYTGVLAIFAARLLNDSPPKIFEDGSPAARLRERVRHRARLPPRARNARRRGRGVQHRQRRGRSVRDIAQRVAAGRGQGAPRARDHRQVPRRRHPPLLCRHRQGAPVLGYTPRVTLEDGLAELAAWLEGQAAVDRVAQASAELTARGLAI